MTGLEGIYNQLMSSCKSEGLEIIETKGQVFDPNLHEAMGHVETSEMPEDSIYDEVRRGYMLGGKLLRAPMVRLAKGGLQVSASAESNADAPAEEASAEAIADAPAEKVAEEVPAEAIAEAPAEAVAEEASAEKQDAPEMQADSAEEK